MIRVYGCIVNEHDLRILGVAAFIAVFGSYTAVELLWHVRHLAGASRQRWLAAASLAAGAAIWTTHFVGMAAFQPSLPATYGLGSIVGSLFAALSLTWLGLWIGCRSASVSSRVMGGAMVGVGIATMHYTGMSGMNVPAIMTWDAGVVAVSIVAGCVLSIAFALVALAPTGKGGRIVATALFSASICVLHFTGMSAVALTPIAADGPASVLSPAILAGIVSVICLLLLLLGTAALGLSRRMARQQEAERTNLRDLADLAVEGLLVCDGDTIVTANDSLCRMGGIALSDLVRLPVSRLFDRAPAPGFDGFEGAVELTLVVSAALSIPVEVVRKPIFYSGRPHNVLAVRDLRARQKAEAEIRYLAHHDPLTGILNRAAFGVELKRKIDEHLRRHEPFALLALDLDCFKEVNDTLGHHVGDVLLQRVANRLRRTIRETDCFARLGGDEFAILASAPITADEVAVLGARLVEMVRRPFIIREQVVHIGLSVGVTLASTESPDQDSLMRNADMALYRAKADGRGTVRFFEEAMDQKVRESRLLEIDLRKAIINDEVKVYYQPLLDVATQTISGFEALARWESPSRGMVMPGIFIPVAEQTGLIVEIGEYVLLEATRQAAEWGPDISIAVNLSAVQFSTGNILSSVSRALAKSGLTPNRLQLEITETILLQRSDKTQAVLHALRNMGVRIAMDDFGNGYSSLRYLRSFPFDRIKIDQSFVREMLDNKESAAIVWAVLGLARRLGIATTAEGVETEAQREYLEQEGCDTLQGYLLGRPQAAKDAGRLIRLHDPTVA